MLTGSEDIEVRESKTSEGKGLSLCDSGVYEEYIKDNNEKVLDDHMPEVKEEPLHSHVLEVKPARDIKVVVEKFKDNVNKELKIKDANERNETENKNCVKSIKTEQKDVKNTENDKGKRSNGVKYNDVDINIDSAALEDKHMNCIVDRLGENVTVHSNHDSGDDNVIHSNGDVTHGNSDANCTTVENIEHDDDEVSCRHRWCCSCCFSGGSRIWYFVE